MLIIKMYTTFILSVFLKRKTLGKVNWNNKLF